MEESSIPQAAPERGGQKLAREEEKKMFRALQDLFENVEKNQVKFNLDGSLDEAESENPHLVALEEVKANLDLLWGSGSDYMAQCAEILANASRSPVWRDPYGRIGILNFFLRIIATENVQDDILIHSLRLVGNSCADTDENRQRVLDGNYTQSIVRLFQNKAKIPFAIPVIYNICADFEPAQNQAAENGLAISLLNLLANDIIEGDALLNLAYELVEMASEQARGVEKSPDVTLAVIIKLAARPNPDLTNFATIVNCLTAYLQNERFQQVCISKKLVDDVISVLRQSFNINPTDLSPEEVQALAQVRLKLNQSLSDVSAHGLFSKEYPVGSPLFNNLKSCLDRSEDQLQVCACVMLGNLARDDETCEALVEKHEIHLSLISILHSDAKGGVLHAALGILKNLAIASNNKERLGSSGVIKAVSRLYTFDSIPQVQLSATSLTRQVIVSSLNNISRLLKPLSSDADSPASPQTYLSLLLSLFTETDSAPIKTEIGRTVAAICRVISQHQQGTQAADEASPLSERLFTLHEDVARPVGAMITQTEWPVVQSEGWFALALMSSTQSGSLAVVDCLQSMNIFELLGDTVRAATSEPQGEDAPQNTDQLKKKKDRDNAIILVNGLLNNNPSTLPSDRKDTLEDLMREVAEVARP